MYYLFHIKISEISQHVCGMPFARTGRESYTGTEARRLLHEEAGNRLIEKLTRQEATDPKQIAVTYHKEQVDRHPPPKPTTSIGKLKSRRTNTATRDITTRSPINEQRPQEIARVTYLTLI